MKKGVFIVLTCVMSTVLMFILYFLSGTINHKKNSFIRLFPPHPVILFKTIDIKFNSWYIAGETANHIYLGNVTAPLHVLDINTLKGDTRDVIIKMNESKKYAIRSMKLTVDSPRFYLADGVTPALLRGNISDWQAGRYLFDSLYFSQSVPLGETSFVVR